MARTARIYRSYEDFERSELRSLEQLNETIDSMLDDSFTEELDFEAVSKRQRNEAAFDFDL